MTANTETRFRYPRRPIWVRALNLLVHHAPLRPRYGHNSILMRRALCDDDMGFPPGGNAGVREATRHDLEHMINHAEALPRSVYATRLAHGDRCFCLVAGSEVRSFNWVTHDRACVMRGFENAIDFLDLTPDQAFTYDFYTYTACRGRGAGRDLKRGIIAALAREGGREVLSLVRPESPASLHLHVSLGYQPDCSVYGYRLGSWQHTFFSPCPSRSQLQAWARDAVPTGG